MGLPELTFTLTQAAETAAARLYSGNVALILRDAKANGVYTIHRESDFPAGLGAANADYIRRAMIGSINRPAVLYAAVIPTAGKIADGFGLLSTYDYDYLAGPPDISAEDATALGKLVSAQHKKRYVGKVVLPETAADSECVVNFSASGIQAGETTFTAGQYASRIAGVLAGTPVECSATGAELPEVTAVDAVSAPDAAVDAGKLILVDDGRRVILGRAVTSKVTLQKGEPAALKKIKLVGALDLIRHYAITTVEDQYLGKCPNTYDNKCILISALRDYLQELERLGILEPGSWKAELDAEAIRAYLIQRATDAGDLTEVQRIKELSDKALQKEPTDSRVFVRLSGMILDSMEDFGIVFETR